MKHFLVQTFGCQMNVHDSLRIEETLHAEGYRRTEDPSLADVVIVNTCSVREKAEHKLMSLLGRLRPHKESRPGRALVVAGCVAQQEGERLLRRAPYVDVVLGPDNIVELPGLLRELEQGGPPRVRTVFDLETPEFLELGRSSQGAVCAYVTVMKGCDERCTFCVVPYTRGPERYREADSILHEIRVLAGQGVREITLLGQTVNSWYDPRFGKDARPSEFAGLLRRIAEEVPELLRLRYTSPHPRHLTPELIRAHAELPLLAKHVHLPFQSGSNRILRRMSRRYTREEYLARIAALKEACPGLTLSADIIVGFPSESEEDFQQTLDLVEEAGFAAAFAFKYSPRPHTPALKLGDDVPEEVKDERLARLFERIDAQQSAQLGSLVGKDVEVLIEGPSRDGKGRFTGRSERNEIVHVAAPPGFRAAGQLVRARVEHANGHSLLAEMQEELVPGIAANTAPEGPLPKRRVHLPLSAVGGA